MEKCELALVRVVIFQMQAAIRIAWPRSALQRRLSPLNGSCVWPKDWKSSSGTDFGNFSEVFSRRSSENEYSA